MRRQVLPRLVSVVTAMACGVAASSIACSTEPEGVPTPPLSSSVAPSATVAPSAGEPPAEPDASAPSVRPVVRSAGCGKAISEAPGLSARKTLDVAGTTRELFTALPAGYDPSHAYPVVLVLHGATETEPEGQFYAFPLQKYAKNAIYVYPQALPRTRADGTGGLVTRWDLEGDADLVFVDALLDHLGRTYCIAERHAFATGFSSGGNFSQQLGCKRKNRIAAIAPVSGPGPFSPTCDGPMAVLMTHDVDDSSLSIASARASRDFWVKQNGCKRTFEDDAPAGCKRAVGCPVDAPVIACESTGVGHAVAPFAVERAAAHLRGFFPPD